MWNLPPTVGPRLDCLSQTLKIAKLSSKTANPIVFIDCRRLKVDFSWDLEKLQLNVGLHWTNTSGLKYRRSFRLCTFEVVLFSNQEEVMQMVFKLHYFCKRILSLLSLNQECCLHHNKYWNDFSVYKPNKKMNWHKHIYLERAVKLANKPAIFTNWQNSPG